MNQQQREGEFLLQSGTIDTRDASPKQSLTVTFQVSREPAPLHRATATDMAHQGKSQRRRRAGWAGIKDRSPLGQTSWWFTDDRRQSGHLQGRGSDSDATLSRCNSDSTHGVGGGGNGGKDFNCRGHGQGRDQRFSSRENARSRKRDWFKELFAARNLATVVYGVSYTTSQSALPFMANRLVNPQESTGPGDPGSEGVREAWRGMAYGLVMSGYFITKMMSAPWIGYLSDKVGRRQALVVTLTGVGLSFLATKIWGQFSIQGLILCRLLMGCFAANGALIHAYIKDTVPPEWQSSAFSQHTASWGCAHLMTPALIAWTGDNPDAIFTLSTVAMVIAAMIVGFTFVDTRPEGLRSHRMRDIAVEYLKEGARHLAEVGKKMSGVDLADYFNSGREKDPPASPFHNHNAVSSPPPSMATTGTLTRMSSCFSRDSSAKSIAREDSEVCPEPLSGGGGELPRGESGNRGGGDFKGAADGLRLRSVARGRGGGRPLSSGGRGVSNGHTSSSSLPIGDTNRTGRKISGGDGSAREESCTSLEGAAATMTAAGGGDAAIVVGERVGGTMDENADANGEKGGGRRKRPSPLSTVSTRALVDVFKHMMTERLIVVTFVLKATQPAQDLAPLVALKFSGGASVLAGIMSSRSLCRALVPMTPLIPWLVRLAGGSSSQGATARMGGDRAVAACMCVLMAGLVAAVPAVGSLQHLHQLMFIKGLCSIVRDSTAAAVMAGVAGTSSVGAFFGWQHCIKGIQGTVSTFLTGWLSGYSISMPYYVVAICDLLYAFTYLFI